ncbi:hypothetical protein M0802_010736 [Mischocyttarus mexicanus]|nr:hypothetical protein M0802_010736 [Mischocyttarus mexicanus]
MLLKLACNVGWLVGSLVGWLVGLLVGWLTIGTTTNFHTCSIKNRKYWNIFDYALKNTTKDIDKSPKSLKDDPSNKLDLSSKNVINSTELNTSKLITNNYAYRYVPRIKSNNKIQNTKKCNHFNNNLKEFTSILDGNYISNNKNMNYKLKKGSKLFQNELSKDFNFLFGYKSLDLDILSGNNNNNNKKSNLSRKLQKTRSYNKLKTNLSFQSKTKICKKLSSNSISNQNETVPKTEYKTNSLINNQIKSEVETKTKKSLINQLKNSSGTECSSPPFSSSFSSSPPSPPPSQPHTFQSSEKSQGSECLSYSPTLQTNKIYSKCYNTRINNPIIRSNSLSFDPDTLKTRNTVTCATISTINHLNNFQLNSKIKPKGILFGSMKSLTGLKTSQLNFYGSCKKSKKTCNDDYTSCCKKKRQSDCNDDEMIPGKVICTKPKKDCCKKRKRCRSEKKICCTKKSTLPPPPPPPPRPSCCKSKPKKKKVCKRYCCPALQIEDCDTKRSTCPTKTGKCQNDYKVERDDHRQKKLDPTCLPIDKPTSQKYDSNDTKDDNDCYNSNRDFCKTSKKCNTKRDSCYDEKDYYDDDDNCLDDYNEQQQQQQREICTKPKRKKDCCNSKRNFRRSKSCNNRRYHSETKQEFIRKSKSSVTIPIFDVSVVLFRPYQNDPVLRFYSTIDNHLKPLTSIRINKSLN